MQPPGLQAGHAASVQRGIAQDGFNGLKLVILRLWREQALERARKQAEALRLG